MSSFDQPRPLRGLAAMVSLDQLKSLLSARSPAALDDPEMTSVLTEALRGIGSEVAAVVGPTFSDTDDLDALELGVWAVTVGTAAALESSLFPEGVGGDDSRANVLQVKYLSLLKSLQGYVGTGGPDVLPHAFTVSLWGG